jgi:hypothetical protein
LTLRLRSRSLLSALNDSNIMLKNSALFLTIATMLCFSVAAPLFAQTEVLAARPAAVHNWSSAAFSVGLDDHGLITSLRAPSDPLKMDWVREEGPAWGLPMTREHGKLVTWDAPTIATLSDHAEELHFKHGPFDLVLKQSLSSEGKLLQSYTLRNTSAVPVSLAEGDFGIRIPLPDNYPDAATALTERSNVHVWTGGSVAWVEAIRMNGHGPHLGLVLTEGALTAYSITDRPWDSNDRGTFVLQPPAMVLAPGKSTTIAWTIFWNNGWDDFFSKAMRTPEFIRLQAKAYTISPGQPLEVTADAGMSLENATITVNGRATHPILKGNHLDLSFMPLDSGDQQVELTLGTIHTQLRAYVSPEPLDLIGARVRFLIEHQQKSAPGEPVDGAFLIYDNQTGKQILEEARDHNAARERVGMGLLLALYLPHCKDPQLRAEIQKSLDRFWKFVNEHLQDPTGRVFNNTDDPTQRLYNYPWVAQLHLTMYQDTHEARYLDAYVRTIRAFYTEGGQRFYPIGLPIDNGLAVLSEAGRAKEHDELLGLFRGHADRIIATGTSMPKSEVNYEQSIVGPASGILLEVYLATKEQKYLAAARPFLDALFAFNGQQPDHHLNDIAIRHWDDFWFGKSDLYGDTFPQYWSTITAMVLGDVAQTDPAHAVALRARSANIVANNFSLFKADGSASCAYVYPLTVDDKPGRFYDAWANDQDWALVHYLLLAEQAPIQQAHR